MSGRRTVGDVAGVVGEALLVGLERHVWEMKQAQAAQQDPIAIRYAAAVRKLAESPGGATDEAVAHELGVNDRTVRRWRREERIPKKR